MSQNKSVEEVSIDITSHLAGILPSALYDRLENDIIEAIQQERQTLQEREREIVKVIENMTVENANINFKVNENVLDFANSLLTEFKRKALRTLTNPNED